MPDHVLFNQSNIYDVLRNQGAEIKRRVQAIPANLLLNASEQDLIDSLVEEIQLTVPVLKGDEIYIAESVETQVDLRRLPNAGIFLDGSHSPYVPGHRTVIAIPFEGEAAFFDVQPQTHGSPPQAEISNGEILLTYVRTEPDAAAIRRECQQTLSHIKWHLDSLEQSAKEFNSRLEALITSELRQRKGRLLANANMTAAIGLPMKKRSDAPTTYSVPVKKRIPRIEELKSGTAQFEPEPVLANEEYEEVLRIMKSMVHVMEQSPRAFQGMGEEHLRTHFLVQLNGQYQGQATGETFNYQGKTDILIRAKDRNVFIAECKFWNGEKALFDTIDQLLSYLAWRDTKAAVLIFNRNANFSAVLSKVASAVPKHPQFKRDCGRSGESTFRYVFAQPNDPDREITLTVLAFDIPAHAS